MTKGGTLALIISRWGGDGPVSFKIWASNGTAKIGTDVLWQDYFGQSNNDSDQFISVTLPATFVNNSGNESGKYFYIWLSPVSPADTNVQIMGTTVTILNNENDVGVPVMEFSAQTYDVIEGDTAHIPVLRSGGVGPAWVNAYISIYNDTGYSDSDARPWVDFNTFSETTYSTADNEPAMVDIQTLVSNYSTTSTKRFEIWISPMDPAVSAEPTHAYVYIHARNDTGPAPTTAPASNDSALSVGTIVSNMNSDTYVTPDVATATPSPSVTPVPSAPQSQPSVIDTIVNSIRGLFGLK